MIIKTHKAILTLLLLLCCTTLLAQENVRVTADRNSTAVGEPIVLTLEYRLSGTGSPVVQWPDSIPHLEWVARHPYKKIEKGKQRWLLQEMIITSYDKGKWVLPAVTLLASGKKIQTTPLKLGFYYSADSHTDNYHDIKDIEAVPAPESSWYYWVITGIVLLIAIYVLKKSRKKKVVPASVQHPQNKSAYEQACKELQQLKLLLKDKHPDMKFFYTQLVDVFRKFVSEKKQFSSMQKTNGELIAFLQTCSLPEEQLRQLVRQLELGDEVKFAMHKPGKEEAEKSFFLIELAMKFMNT